MSNFYNVCKPNDIECLNKHKLVPVLTFVDKVSRKMTLKGCRVSMSENEDAINAIHGVGGISSLESLDDVKIILKSALSKTDHCDRVFDQAWNELLFPQREVFGGERGLGDLQIPPGMKPIIEKHIAHIIQQAAETEGMKVNEKEMEELLKEGKVKAMEGKGEGEGKGMTGKTGGMSQRCNQHLKGGASAEGIGQCLADINKQIKDMIDDSFKSKQLSKIRQLGSQTEQMIDQISKEINADTEISNEDAAKLKKYINDLRKFKDFLKKAIDSVIPKMDITPDFEDPEAERKFIDSFMKGAVGAWGAPQFVGAVSQLDSFKSRLREGLKQLKSTKGQQEEVRQRGKMLAAQYTIRQGMRKGLLIDTFYKTKPPKQKEDVVWLVDTSGSMSQSYSFIQPIVDSLNYLGIKQKFFLGTEDGLEVLPTSNFQDTLENLKSSGTVLSGAYDDIKPKIGSFKDKTFIIYSDMELGDSPEDFNKRLDEVVSEGGKVLILNATKRPYNDKFIKGLQNREPVLEFTDVGSYEKIIEVLKEAAPILKK